MILDFTKAKKKRDKAKAKKLNQECRDIVAQAYIEETKSYRERMGLPPLEMK